MSTYKDTSQNGKEKRHYKEIELDFSSVPQWKMDVYQIIADFTIYRLKHDITQTELAERMSISQSVIARFERAGRMPTIEFIYKIAKGLGVELEPLKLEPVNQILKNEEIEQDFPDVVFAEWEQNVYRIVTDLTVCRVQQRISQTELAKRINTTQSVITRFERLGRIPTIEFLYRVAEGLGVKILPFRICAEEKIIQHSWGPLVTQSFDEIGNSISDQTDCSAVFSEEAEQAALSFIESYYEVETIGKSSSKLTTIQGTAESLSCKDKSMDDNACKATTKNLLAA